MTVREYNFDGIVGPTHNYAGLSWGNLASTRHYGAVARPRQAVLQGLQKMKRVHDLGIGQAVIPPLPRPRLDLLRELGFAGGDQQLIDSACEVSPPLVAACFSASSMWTANAATVSPSPDSADGRLHLTPANLLTSLHRAIEADQTMSLLQAIFPASDRFVVHRPLAGGLAMSDEGAANHTRLTPAHGRPGIHLFVYGQSALDKSRPRPVRFPARQTLEASQAVARCHGLDPGRVLFLQQHPEAIDAGVFHNDVIAVGNADMLLAHERAFAGGMADLEAVRQIWQRHHAEPLSIHVVQQARLSLDEAVSSYLFNSQLLSRPDGGMSLLCPAEVGETAAAAAAARDIIEADNPVDDLQFVELRQSMNNGGGPACLRLRVVMSDDEWNAVHQGVRFDQALYAGLTDWANRNYREELKADDLRDPDLREEIDTAFRQLAEILCLPPALFGLDC